MNRVNILRQETRMENGILIVNREVEEKLTRADVEQEIAICKRQMMQLVNQSRGIKTTYDEYSNKLDMLEDMLSKFEIEGIESIESL